MAAAAKTAAKTSKPAAVSTTVPIDQRIRLSVAHAAPLLDTSKDALYRAITWDTATSTGGWLHLPETPPIHVHRSAENGRTYIYRADIDAAITSARAARNSSAGLLFKEEQP